MGKCYRSPEWMVLVTTIYLLSFYYEMEKDSCCLLSCESFIGPQLRMGRPQALQGDNMWNWGGQVLDYQDTSQDGSFLNSSK